ncbi:MAG: hypothetical protein PVG52_07070, partial [Desulfobacterales bacterium]
MATATNTSLTRPELANETPPSLSEDRSEDEFSRLAHHLLKKAYLSDKQVEYARRVQSKLEKSRPLVQVIKELEFITD